ncbi:PHIKZ185.1 [Pseudomonas phage phiKZ]|uniref:PHIKZ185.1 n=5 Tax=Viruses TaxID=10239 RepID=L7T4A8_BPDPK|nr:PHIKZ185.1 [Pseudomonas phage phiKZ]AGC26342.1 PHIKZ185.1 [Pseudomonas phage phiKZ]
MVDLIKSAQELTSHLGPLNKVLTTINLIGMPDALKEVVKLPDVKCVVYKRPLTDNLIKVVFNDGSCFVIKDVN